MTSPVGPELRAFTAEEAPPERVPLVGHGFELAPTRARLFKPTGAPVTFYDVVVGGTEKVGIASVIIEADAEKVSSVGHVCATIDEAHATGDLLEKVGSLLIQHAHSKGIDPVLIVVRNDSTRAVSACEALGPARREPVETGDGQFVEVFEYSRG